VNVFIASQIDKERYFIFFKRVISFMSKLLMRKKMNFVFSSLIFMCGIQRKKMVIF
jgi:hypothetical protein